MCLIQVLKSTKPGASSSSSYSSTATTSNVESQQLQLGEVKTNDQLTKEASTQYNFAVKGYRSIEIQTTLSMLNCVDAETQVDYADFVINNGGWQQTEQNSCSMYEQCYSSDCDLLSDPVSSQITEPSCEDTAGNWSDQTSDDESTMEDDIQNVKPHIEEKYLVFKSFLF